MLIDSSEPAGPVVQMRLEFRAPRRMIYRVFTEAELLKKWHFADPGWETHSAEIDLRPLGVYKLGIRARDRSFESTIHGHFIEVDDQQRIAYTFTGAAASAAYWTLVTVRFWDREGGSGIDLTHGIFETEEHRMMHEQGWIGCLTQLAALLGEDVESR